MWVAKGRMTKLRCMERSDVDKMQNWGRHTDPLLLHYNFPKMNSKERDEWYRIKAKRFNKKSFAIENFRGEVVGYLSIRNIKWLKKESELGIVLDPNHMNKGYGADAIKAFLNYYFTELKMASIILRAATYNERAVYCYLKCGFEKVGEENLEFEDQGAEIFYNPAYRNLKKFFIERNKKMMTRYIQMRITDQEFAHKKNDISTSII